METAKSVIAAENHK